MPLNDRLTVCAQAEEPKAEPRVEPKPDPTGKHMYATKVRLRISEPRNDVTALLQLLQCTRIRGRTYAEHNIGWQFGNLQEDAKDAFKQLLRDKGISSEATWDQAMRLITNDSRCAHFHRQSGQHYMPAMQRCHACHCVVTLASVL